MEMRRLGRSGIPVSALGFGTYGISGPYWDNSRGTDVPMSYGVVDDAESVRAIQRALEVGINFFDTADEYGCGHAERLLGQALAGQRQRAVIATKFGYQYDEATRRTAGTDASPAYIRTACEASLRRLRSEWIDLYLLHLRDLDMEAAHAARDTLEALVQEGKIRFYGWSTDDLERARFFAEGAHCTAIEHAMNIFMDNPGMLALCEQYDLASVNRVPFLSGVLTGKFNRPAALAAEDRRSEWDFADEKGRQVLGMVAALEACFAPQGRSLPQVALGWLWARSPRTLPIPGIRSVRQVEENAAALAMGPLSEEQMEQVGRILAEAGHVSRFSRE